MANLEIKSGTLEWIHQVTGAIQFGIWADLIIDGNGATPFELLSGKTFATEAEADAALRQVHVDVGVAFAQGVHEITKCLEHWDFWKAPPDLKTTLNATLETDD